jgi:hypothetical protein
MLLPSGSETDGRHVLFPDEATVAMRLSAERLLELAKSYDLLAGEKGASSSQRHS